MSYHFIEVSDVLMAEHDLIAKQSVYSKDLESAVKIAMFNEGVNAMAAAMLGLINKEDDK